MFHAGGQDVEIIYNFTGRTPHPIFDTQIAMMAISQSEQIGYSNLVESWLGITVDKGARFTDWSRRPLTERQIEYAIGDVTHLAKIFPKMLARLRKTGRGEWLDQEMEKLADPANYRNDPDLAWLRIKAPGRNPAVLGRLKAIAAWREREAQDKNIPRGRIVRDETLADIASHPPKSQADLAKVRGLSPGWKENEIGRRLMQTLERAKPLRDEDLPPRTPRGAPLGKEGALVADLLKLLLKIRGARDRRRRAAAGAQRRARTARRRGAPGAADARELALRAVRARRARARRGQAGVRGRGREAQDDPRRRHRRHGRRCVTTYYPTIKQLQYLVALHQHGHFGRAADACFVSQSTLSAGLRDLEQLLGVVLVERTKRAVRFTPLGNQVVAKAHRILRETEELVRSACNRPASRFRARCG